MKKHLFLAVFLIFMTACTAPVEFDDANEKIAMELQKVFPAVERKIDDLRGALPVIKKSEESNGLPEKINLEVPFASQAPLLDWQLPYQEACEEAALITAYKYFAREDLNKDVMDAEIKKLVDWETQKYDFYSDSTAEEVVAIGREYFNLNIAVSADVSVEKIKIELAAGHLVLAPTAGRLLGNPNYSGRGPLYHFLVIRGYDSKHFITNDVGTRKGEEYKYDFDVVLNAIHDLPLKTDGSIFRPYDEQIDDAEKAEMMQKGAKKMLVVSAIQPK